MDTDDRAEFRCDQFIRMETVTDFLCQFPSVRLSIGMNDLAQYVEDLDAAILTPYPPYEQLGTVVDGEWRQLSTSILQIENEYYGQIRPKQVARSGERPTHALERRGIAYVEVVEIQEA